MGGDIGMDRPQNHPSGDGSLGQFLTILLEPTGPRPLAPHRSLQAPGPCRVTRYPEVTPQGPGASGEL